MRFLKVISGILFLIGALLIVGAMGGFECGGAFQTGLVIAGFIMLVPFIVVHDLDDWKVEKVREKDFEKKVKDFLKLNGCWVLKTWSNGIQREGIPDLLVCCNGFFLGIELKNETGHPSELQLWNIRKIRNAKGIALVLYPDQFPQFQKLIENLIRGDFWYAIQNQEKFDRKEK